MTGDLASIAAALRDALKDYGLKRSFDYVPDAVAVPCAIVGYPDVAYDNDMSNTHTATFRVHLLVGRATDRTAYKNLTPHLAPSKVKAALELDGTIRVTAASVSPIAVAETDYIGATFTVEVFFEEEA
jgi:hypothetical protein